MKRGNSAVVSLSDPTQNEAALLLICNWLSGKYVAQQAENVRQASEIIRLKDELADVRDILQHRITTPPLDMSVIENNSTVVTELLEKLTLSQMADSAIAKTMIVQSQKAEDKTPAKSVHEEVSTDNIVDSSLQRLQARRKVSTKVSTDTKNGQSVDSSVDRITQYQLHHPGASVRKTTDDLKLKKSKVGEIIKQLQDDGMLPKT